MPFGEEEFHPKPQQQPEERPRIDEEAREHRLAARRFYRAAPPYCVQFEVDGTVTLRQKAYEYWPELEPEDATTWTVLSTHENLEEAERRLRLICGPSIYYDADGNPTKAPRRAKPRWPMPPTDGE
jgi:hypothetical protein